MCANLHVMTKKLPLLSARPPIVPSRGIHWALFVAGGLFILSGIALVLYLDVRGLARFAQIWFAVVPVEILGVALILIGLMFHRRYKSCEKSLNEHHARMAVLFD